MSRTVVDIDDRLMKKARRLTGMTKKVEIVNRALKLLVDQQEIEKLLELRGKVEWEGDLEEMRRGRNGAH